MAEYDLYKCFLSFDLKVTLWPFQAKQIRKEMENSTIN